MNEDTFNMEVRKFLKVVGVTSQREIENAVHTRGQSGRPFGKLKARMTLEIAELGLTHVIEGEIDPG